MRRAQVTCLVESCECPDPDCAVQRIRDAVDMCRKVCVKHLGTDMIIETCTVPAIRKKGRTHHCVLMIARQRRQRRQKKTPVAQPEG